MRKWLYNGVNMSSSKIWQTETTNRTGKKCSNTKYKTIINIHIFERITVLLTIHTNDIIPVTITEAQMVNASTANTPSANATPANTHTGMRKHNTDKTLKIMLQKPHFLVLLLLTIFLTLLLRHIIFYFSNTIYNDTLSANDLTI